VGVEVGIVVNASARSDRVVSGQGVSRRERRGVGEHAQVTGRVVSEERGEGEDFVSLILRRPRDTKDADMTAGYSIDSEDQEAARVWKMECETTKSRKGSVFGIPSGQVRCRSA
jgi:hypothetical protein